MEIREYQRRAKKTKFAKDADAYFHGLIGEVGSIFSAHKKSIRSSENMHQIRAELDEQIGDAIWYLSAIASEYNVSLNRVLKNNLKKTANHFIGEGPKYFDKSYPEDQRLPRRMSVRFIRSRRGKVTLTMNRKPLGNELEDNSMKPDGYRFHDVFHLSFATFLGWSPVLRRLTIQANHGPISPLITEIDDPCSVDESWWESLSPRGLVATADTLNSVVEMVGPKELLTSQRPAVYQRVWKKYDRCRSMGRHLSNWRDTYFERLTRGEQRAAI